MMADSTASPEPETESQGAVCCLMVSRFSLLTLLETAAP